MILQSAFVITLFGILGLMFGSFFNVCVHRIPLRKSIVTPGSHCPSCSHAIAWYDNIPLLSWLLLKGHCRYCAQPIAIRYPLLEGVVGISWAWLAAHYGLTPVLLQALVLVSLLWILSWIDLETGLLPDVLTYTGMLAGLGFAWYFGYIEDALIGCVAGYGVFWLVSKVFLLLTGKQGMGHGDFKLLAMLGAFMGWQALPFIIFASSFIGVLVGGLWLWVAKKGRQAQIPFGPYLALAGIVWFIWGFHIIEGYISLLGASKY